MVVKQFAAAIATLVIATAAQATSSVSSSLTDFSLTVDQGTFGWTREVGQNYSMYAVSSDAAFYVASPIDQAGGWGKMFDTASASTTLTNAVASASVGSNSLSALVTTPAAGGSAYATAQWNGLFDLGENSKVTFSWKESRSGTNSGALGSFGYSIIGFGDGYQSVNHYYSDASANWSTVDHGITYTFWSAGDTHFASLSNTDAISSLNFHARVEVATNDIAAVPEPESLALAFSGLAVAGFLARRRRQQ